MMPFLSELVKWLLGFNRRWRQVRAAPGRQAAAATCLLVLGHQAA